MLQCYRMGRGGQSDPAARRSLVLAVRLGDTHTVEHLVRCRGLSVTPHLLSLAVTLPDPTMLLTLATVLGTQVNQSAGAAGEPVLVAAVRTGREDMVRAIASLPAIDLNIRDSRGKSGERLHSSHHISLGWGSSLFISCA